jgi:hypothetical protein
MLLWFGNPENIRGFLAYATAQPQYEPWFTWESLLYYPRNIVAEYSFSPLFALAILGGLIWAGLQWPRPAVRMLLLYFVVGLAVTIVKPKEPRFIATFVPAAHLLTGLMISSFLAHHFQTAGRVRHFYTAGVAIVFLLILLSLPTVWARFERYPAGMRVAYETDPTLNEIAGWIDEQLPDNRRFFMINSWDQFGPQSMAWYLGQKALERQQQVSFEQVMMPSAVLDPATPEEIARVRQYLVQSGAEYLVLFEGGPWGAPFWPEYTAAMQEGLTWTAENTFLIDYPVIPGVTHSLHIKVIIYQLHPPSL